MKQHLRSILWLWALFILPGLVFSQRTISGTITDAETGETLIGANVLILSTTSGTITDIDGNYSLEVPLDAKVIQFSYTGYATQSIEIGTSNIIDIQMSSGQLLDEVIVIGYGTVTREDATGSVQTVGTEDFNKGAITSAQELIAGKVPGVSVSPSADPGGGATIRIRGGSSLNAVNDPLIVIDGVPVESRGVAGARNPLNLVNPNDIETVTVLKDASATAIYGSRASNGVIIITTKKGSIGDQMNVQYNGSVAVSDVSRTRNVMTGDEFRTLINERFPDNAPLLGTENTNWQDQIFQSGLTSDHNLSLAGSDGVLPYRVSVGYTNKDGIVRRDNFQRITGGLRLTPGFFDNKLQVNASLKGMQIKNQFANRGAIGSAVAFDPTQPVHDANSPYGGYFTHVNPDGSPNTVATSNPVAMIEQKNDNSQVERMIASLAVDYRFGFLPELRANMVAGYDVAEGKGGVREPTNAAFVYDAATGGGTKNHYEEKISNELFDFYLNYVKNIGRSKIDLMAGYGYQHFKFDKTDSRSDEAGTPENVVNILTAREFYLVSLFSRLNVNLGERILLTGTIRRDGTSRFSEKNRYGIFPAAAVAFKIVDPSKTNGVLNNLKLRAGWGVTGQQDIGENFYPYIPSYTVSLDNASYQFGDDFVNTYRPGGYNADLKWEETTTYNAGLEFGLFNDRIYGSVEYYLRETEDLLLITRPAAGTNLTNNVAANIGTLENTGLELALNVMPIRKSNMNWSFGVNLTRNQNEITALERGNDLGLVAEDSGISGGVGNRIQIHSVGFPSYSFYVYEQVYNEAGNPIEGVYVDRNGDGSVTPADRYQHQSPHADYFIGLSSNFDYGAFDFSFAGRASIGNYVYDNGLANFANYNRVSSASYLSNVDPSVRDLNINTPQYFSDHFVNNASYFVMDHITAGYRFDNVFGENNDNSLRVYITAQRPFIITKYEGLDPQVFEKDKFGIDNDVYPRSRTILFGVNLSL